MSRELKIRFNGKHALTAQERDALLAAAQAIEAYGYTGVRLLAKAQVLPMPPLWPEDEQPTEITHQASEGDVIEMPSADEPRPGLTWRMGADGTLFMPEIF
jgi:hypothetical protein